MLQIYLNILIKLTDTETFIIVYKRHKTFLTAFLSKYGYEMELVYIYRPIISIYRTIETIAILKTLLPILLLLPDRVQAGPEF